MNMAEIQILDETFSISHSANTLGKTGFFDHDMVTFLGEGKL